MTAVQRLAEVDALRGFALLGILLVNISAFSSTFYGLEIADPGFDGPIDRATRFVLSCLFEAKFYLLFSFLFGYSVTLQMQSAEAEGQPLMPRMLRRQAGLWVIGLLHAIFLYQGDILTTYAVLGIVLLMLRRRNDAQLFRLAKWLVAGSALFWSGLGGLQMLDTATTDPASVIAQAEAALRAYRGTPLTVVGQHLQALSTVWVILLFVQAPSALAMFLLGVIAGRRGLLARVDKQAHLFRDMAVAGLCIGLPGGILYAYSSVWLIGSPWELFGLSLGLLTGPLLTGAYVAMAMLFFATNAGQLVCRLLAPAGRMALSNYLLQSLICAVIFHAYGFRLMGEVSPLVALLTGLAIFVVQLGVSRWWMKRFAYGPLEWVLRAITIAAWPCWRLAIASR